MLLDNISERFYKYSLPEGSQLCHLSAISFPQKKTAETLREGIIFLKERYRFLSPLSLALLQALMTPYYLLSTTPLLSQP